MYVCVLRARSMEHRTYIHIYTNYTLTCIVVAPREVEVDIQQSVQGVGVPPPGYPIVLW